MTPPPYCGTAPLPEELLTRFNLDPALIVVLGLALCCQLFMSRPASGHRAAALTGWSVAAIALVSPLCALSVALFSARVGQHMLLVLVAAPLIALGMPLGRRRGKWRLSAAAMTFFVALWFWHMPRPYEATFTSARIYWLMHASLFGSAIWLWRELLHHSVTNTVAALVAGALTSIQMGLLGAMLCLAGHALFRWHLLTTWAFGLSPLEDQQLGGVIMWVPGIALFLWVAIRSLVRMWTVVDGARTT